MTESSNGKPGTSRRTVELTESDRHRLLSRVRRRVALDVLAERRAPIGLDELAGAVVTRERDAAVVDGAAVEQAAAMLHHVHLPKLDDAGVLDYDPASRRVEWCRIPPALQ